MLDEVIKRSNIWSNISEQMNCWASSINIFGLCQILLNIESNDFEEPNMVIKRSNIPSSMVLDEMLGEISDRLTVTLITDN